MVIDWFWGRLRPSLSIALAQACGLALLCAWSTGAIAVEAAKVPEFSLEDQFQNVHRYALPRPQVSVLTAADRKGYTQVEAWVRALKARYGKRLPVDGVADVSIIPSPFHGLVRQGFRHKLSYPVMLDFSGKVIKALNYTKDQANIYVVGSDGQILLRETGVADADALRRVFDVIDRALGTQTARR